jgi:3-methylcrotonyl-CoA carboxylase alpha subunit
MFSKILIANRGEIACRVIRTARAMGIKTVAVYSEPDADALHVREADEAVAIGPAAAAQSYLSIEKIVDACKQTGAEAVHPGYGFLAENPRFAEACAAAGLVFVGPPPEAMRRLGDKRAAKALARQAGVPVAPGYDHDGAAQDEATLAEAARALGFPLLIKAAAGGGGRGMRLVGDEGEFGEALASARREALAAFGDDAVLLERAIASPRHVEVQILADAHDAVVHLGERECSVQRRHQKIIEESPSPAVTPALRAALGEAAVVVARAAGYINAGTVEFLLDAESRFYFLEVNTRLQVEHPVTELVTGLDLVREQIRIAAGEPLGFTQADVRLRGHAIECRVYAEDAARGFLPSTGRLLLFAPPAGPGVRNDVGVETGAEVTPHYDPMLAKLIVGAADRAACVERTLRALRDYAVLGVTTNLPLLHAIVDSSAFRQGALATDLLDRSPELLATDDALPDRALLAAAGWRLTEADAAPARDPWRASPWRVAGQGVPLRLQHATRPIDLTASRAGHDAWRVDLPAGERVAVFERVGESTLLVREEARSWAARVVETAEALHLALDGRAYRLEKDAGLRLDAAAGASTAAASRNALQAPMPGVVAAVNVREGERVEAGQTLLVLEAMKMEHRIVAPHAGTVTRLRHAVGESVPAGATLAEVEET